MFPHELWNMNIRVQEDLPRKNNELEGWHTCFSIIEKLRWDSSLNHLKMAHGTAGAPNLPQRRIYREINESLRTLVDGYGQNNLIGFLRGNSYNLGQ